MTGTIRNKPTYHAYEKGRGGKTRAARTRARASNYRDSARLRRDYRQGRREYRNVNLVEDRLLQSERYVDEHDFEYYCKWTEKMNMWYGNVAQRFDEATRRAIDEQYVLDQEE